MFLGGVRSALLSEKPLPALCCDLRQFPGDFAFLGIHEFRVGFTAPAPREDQYG
jgi:hypothetical protein